MKLRKMVLKRFLLGICVRATVPPIADIDCQKEFLYVKE
jgi:hypothetical protein